MQYCGYRRFGGIWCCLFKEIRGSGFIYVPEHRQCCIIIIRQWRRSVKHWLRRIFQHAVIVEVAMPTHGTAPPWNCLFEVWRPLRDIFSTELCTTAWPVRSASVCTCACVSEMLFPWFQFVGVRSSRCCLFLKDVKGYARNKFSEDLSV